MSNVQRSDEIILGDAEIAFASDILVWLCQQNIIGTIALRNALLALLRYPASIGSGMRIDGARGFPQRGQR